MAADEQTGAAASTQAPEAVARAYFEAVAARDLDAMEGFYEPGGIGEIHGLVALRVPDTYREWFGALFRACPDFRMEILDVLGDGGEKAAVRWRATATFDGEGSFEGLVPNGRSVDVQGCDVLTIRNGRIHHNDAYMNGAEMARQLGALPAAGSTPEKAMTGLLNAKTRASAWLAEQRSKG